MQPVNLQTGKKIFAKRTEIRAVAKAARGDANNLPSRNEQTLDESNESGVKIARFNSRLSQATSFRRIRANFPVGRIYNGSVENWRRCAK